MFFKGKGFNFELGKKTYVMGILNVTPDSFFDGGLYNSQDRAIAHSLKMINDGADIIDIGAQSTRPGHTSLTEEQELSIIRDYLPLICEKTGAVISVDTFYPGVAEYALNNGAVIVNDVSGIFSEDMAYVVKNHNSGWVIMHTGGGTATEFSSYPDGVTADVIRFFDNMLAKCDDFSIPRSNIMLDMGIGFGKNHEENIELIRNINCLKRSDCALLTALSSKRVVANETGADGYDRVFGTIAADTAAIAGGTDMIRIHNVREGVLAAKMADAIYRR